MKTYALKVGDRLIDDILNPHHTQIDPDAIDARLRIMHRFSNDPAALTAHTHRALVTKLAEHRGEPLAITQWCWHHDDHEAIIGDIPGPLKSLLREDTEVLDRVERGLDKAICTARCLRHPDALTRQVVHSYDKAAETIEWLYVLGQPAARWNAPMLVGPDVAEGLLAEARAVA